MMPSRRSSSAQAIFGLLLLFVSGTLWLTRWGIVKSTHSSTAGRATANADDEPQRLIFAAGIVEGLSEPVDVQFELPGRVHEVCVNEGQTVSRNDVLAILDSEIAELSVTMAEAELRSARLQQSDVLPGSSSEKTRQVSFTPEQVTVLKQIANSQVDIAELALRKERLQLQKNRLQSPIDGVVVECRVRPGELAGPQGEPAFRVVDRSRTRIRAWVEELDAMDVRPGLSAAILAPGAATRRYRGSVISCASYVQPKSVRHLNPGERIDVRVREVVIELRDGHELLLGLPVEVFIAPQRPEREKH